MKQRDGMTRLDDFGVVDSAEGRFKQYVAAASKLNPKVRAFLDFMASIKKHLRTDQVIIVRSTVHPNTCRQMLKLLGEDKPWLIAYCPERIVQGFAVRELSELPQIVSGLNDHAAEKASALFSIVSPKIIRTTVAEAELVKLFSNAWRYIQFAVTNQFYMISHNFGVDYNHVRQVMMDGYGRAAALPGADASYSRPAALQFE